MQTLTQEMQQFEGIFIRETEDHAFRAFIFTMEEELDFAGHPVIGAAALLHDLYSKAKEQDSWTIHLNAKSVLVQTKRNENYYSARMNQGKAEFVGRPREINILLSKIGRIFVEGEVCKMATGELLQKLF